MVDLACAAPAWRWRCRCAANGLLLPVRLLLWLMISFCRGCSHHSRHWTPPCGGRQRYTCWKQLLTPNRAQCALLAPVAEDEPLCRVLSQKSQQRVAKAEDARAEVEARHEVAADISELLRRGDSELLREAASLHQQILSLKLERGKLQREEVMMREKVGATALELLC